MESDLTNNPSPTIEIKPVAKQPTFLVTLLSILLIISCLIAGFFAYQTQKLVGELQVIKNTTELVVPSGSPTSTQTSSPVATNSGAPSPTPNTVTCTMDAKICPDGSAVGRSGPNCEFAPCPTTSPQP